MLDAGLVGARHNANEQADARDHQSTAAVRLTMPGNACDIMPPPAARNDQAGQVASLHRIVIALERAPGP
jgi:hypothetical protein